MAASPTREQLAQVHEYIPLDTGLPVLPGPDMCEAECRIALRDAIKDATLAEAAYRHASSLVERAAERMTQCEAEVASFDGLAGLLAEFEVSQLKEAASLARQINCLG